MMAMNVFTILVMVVTVLIGVPGNALVLWVTSVKMKWTVNTIWFWNLALADVIFCLSLLFSIVQEFYTEWLYGVTLCKLLPVVVHLNMFASVFTLVAISIDRCILVTRPVWAQNHRSLRMAWMMCLVIWMFSFLMCLPTVLYRRAFTIINTTYCNYEYNEHIFYDYTEDDSSYDGFNDTHGYTEEEDLIHATDPHPKELIIALLRMVWGFLIPLIIISTCYLQLAFKVRNTRFLRVGRKTTKMVYGIVLAFFATWAPYHILGMVLLYYHNHFLINADKLSVALAYFNSCINPILYVFMGKDMQRTVRRSIYGLMENAFSEGVSRSTEHTRSKILTEDKEVVL
ncbi:C3a anaphylatoxin chemotactic receptor-like [Hyperolius riggenbachi]|uniref:C3a anaphylatoxin chemotactic receptor-like n=1 Tax=Hyperolius riggenbachi TaxID=752182 RepID=UPI0035A29C55